MVGSYTSKEASYKQSQLLASKSRHLKTCQIDWNHQCIILTEYFVDRMQSLDGPD
jgi:hypothetical protein